MVFSSIIFVYIFLPVVLICYYLAEKTGKIQIKNAVLLCASIVFYAWGGIGHLVLLLVIAVVNYLCGILIWKTRDKIRKVIFISCISIDVLNLVFFKYLQFLVSNVELAVEEITKVDFSFGIPEIKLPIGISFFTFQIMSYVIDVYKERVDVQRNLFKLLLYIMMFPQLIAGPIVRYSDVNREVNERKTTLEMAETGVRRFIIGFLKKVFIANAMGAMADSAFLMYGEVNSLYAWMGAVSYTLQIYFDFSAYSDMAIGLGMLFGFHFSENFNYPYISLSIQEFWRRWHISLSTWFRDYVYIPLGGNRKGNARTYINLWIVFALTGIWHGAAWQFVVWGMYHGFFVFAEKLGLNKLIKKLPKILQHFYVAIVVIVGWVFFRADNLQIAVNYVSNMFSLNFHNFNVESVLLQTSSWYVFMFCVAVTLSTPLITKLSDRIGDKTKNICCLLLFALGLIYLSGLTYNPFIYFKF